MAVFRGLARKGLTGNGQALIRLFSWLGNVLWWQNRCDESIQIGEEGLDIIGKDTRSTEAALMNLTIAAGYGKKGDLDKWKKYTYYNTVFVNQLSYLEEFRLVYALLYQGTPFHGADFYVRKWYRCHRHSKCF